MVGFSPYTHKAAGLSPNIDWMQTAAKSLLPTFLKAAGLSHSIFVLVVSGVRQLYTLLKHLSFAVHH